MTIDERDRLGDKLRNAGSAVISQWAAKSDRELLAKLQRQTEKRLQNDRNAKRQARAFNTILCATDFGLWSLKALDLAKQIAVENQASLYIVHVCPTVTVPLGGTTPVVPEAEAVASKRLQEIAAEHLVAIPHDLIVITGDPADRIMELQSILQADLIVVGTQGRGGVPRFFLGSVADRVVRAAECPVLTIRGKS